jgi:hypothetical protein
MKNVIITNATIYQINFKYRISKGKCIYKIDKDCDLEGHVTV